MEAIETITKGAFKLEIFQDMDPSSPEDWDNIGKLVRPRRSLESMDGRDIISEYGNIVYSQIITRDGYYYWIIEKSDLKKEYKGTRKEIIAKGQSYADGMAETMRQYFDGEVYGYRVSVATNGPCDCEDWEEKDSCWGFYGLEDVLAEGNSVLEFYFKQENEAIDFEKGCIAL
jgi:hypothetical protein